MTAIRTPPESEGSPEWPPPSPANTTTPQQQRPTPPGAARIALDRPEWDAFAAATPRPAPAGPEPAPASDARPVADGPTAPTVAAPGTDPHHTSAQEPTAPATGAPATDPRHMPTEPPTAPATGALAIDPRHMPTHPPMAQPGAANNGGPVTVPAAGAPAEHPATGATEATHPVRPSNRPTDTAAVVAEPSRTATRSTQATHAAARPAGSAAPPVGPARHTATPAEPVRTDAPGPTAPGAGKAGPFNVPGHPAFPESTARSMRILPIAADLLPVEISEARHGRKVRRFVVAVIAAFAVALAGWYVAANHQTSLAEKNLVRAEDDARNLTRQQHTFTELVRTQTESRKITEQLESLLARDLQWSHLLTSLQGAAPAGVHVTGVTGALAATTDAKTAASTTIGTLSITGTAPSKAAIAAYVDTLAKVPAFADPVPTDANEQDGKVAFTVRLQITKSALGGRYTSASPSPSGSK